MQRSCGVDNGIFRHSGDHFLQRRHVLSALQQSLGIILGDLNLIGHLLGGAGPISVVGGFAREIGEDLEDDLAPRISGVDCGFYVSNRFGFGSVAC